MSKQDFQGTAYAIAELMASVQRDITDGRRTGARWIFPPKAKKQPVIKWWPLTLQRKKRA